MRELNFEENNRVDIITDQMWAAFDILRGEPISSENYYLILFLLSLYSIPSNNPIIYYLAVLHNFVAAIAR